MRHVLLWGEWLFLFVGVPVALRLRLISFPWLLLLGCIALLVAWWLNRRAGFSLWQFWRGEDVAEERQQLKVIIRRFAISALGMAALVALLFPERLFQFPLRMPLLWAAVFLLYPLFSVYPQELIYRAFFARRYHTLFPRLNVLMLASALAFGWLHVIFRNPLAVFLTLVGGWFFAETYARTRSLRLVCLEHALYGNLIFTIGLGEFFYHGAVPQI